MDKHPILREWAPEEITRKHEPGLFPEQQTTEVAGVVPPDAPVRDLNTLENQANTRGIQVWKGNVSGKDSLTARAELLKAFDEE